VPKSTKETTANTRQ